MDVPAAATSAPAKFGMRPCVGNGKRATPLAASLSQTQHELGRPMGWRGQLVHQPHGLVRHVGRLRVGRIGLGAGTQGRMAGSCLLLAFGWQLQVRHASPNGPIAFSLLILSALWIWWSGRSGFVVGGALRWRPDWRQNRDFGRQRPRDPAATDSAAEEAGFEHFALSGSVPLRAGGAVRGNHMASEGSFSVAGPIVRIHLPPVVSHANLLRLVAAG